MADLTGQTLGKYQLVERLGRGGMADVYKGYQPGLDRYVAVKVLHAHLAEDPEFITRFKREARAVADLHHPYIVQVFDFDVQADNYYMVMEYIEGGKTLKEVLQGLAAKNDRLPLETTLEMMGKLADALAYAHGIGMVHRDIKPANVLIPAIERPVLGDFGIARIVGQTGLTSSGMMVGTPAYMSPEQGKGERGDARSDIYALGIVLYEMLTGHPPYDADTPYAVILKHINDPLVSPRTLIGALPEAIERIVLKCLAKNPDDRFRSMAELRDALRSALAATRVEPAKETLTVAAPETAVTKPPEALPQLEAKPKPELKPTLQMAQPSRRPIWIVAAVGAVIVVAAIVALIASGGGRPAATPQPTEGASVAPTEPAAPPAVSPEAQVQVDVGYEHLFDGDLDAALERFNRALEISADYPPALVGRATTDLYRYENFDRAADDLLRADPAMRDDPHFHFALGLQHMRDEKRYDPQAAERDWSRAIDLCGDQIVLCAQAHYERAQLHAWTSGNYEAALHDMDAAIDLLPGTDWLHASRADIRWAADDAAGAMGDLEAAYGLSHYGNYLERAAAYAVHVEDYQRAQGYYNTQLLVDQPDNPHYAVNRAYVKWRSGGINRNAPSGGADAAWQMLDEIYQQHDPLEAHYLAGLMRLEAEQPQEALAELEHVAAVTDPDILYQATFPFLMREFGHEANYDTARAAHALGDVDAALDYIDRSLKDDEWWPYPYLERGRIYVEQGDTDRAREDFNKALEIALETEPGNAELHAQIQELLVSVAEGVIKIAVQGPLSGSLASWGIGFQRATELAIDQMGGALREANFVVQLAPFDDTGNVEKAGTLAQAIIAEPDVLCVVGPLMSRMVLAESEAFHRAGLVMISPSATSPQVTARGYVEINRVNGRDDVQVVVGAGYARSLGVQSAYLIRTDEVYSAGVVDVFQQAAAELGLDIAGVETVSETDAEADVALAAKIVSANPDMVYFAGFFDRAAPLFKEIRAQGYEGLLMGPDGLDNPDLLRLAGETLLKGKGIVYSTIAGPPQAYPGAADFVAAYRDRFGDEPPPFAAQAYDAAGICLSAIRVLFERDGRLPARAQVAGAVRGTDGYDGITGTLSFNAQGDLKVARYFIIRVTSADPDKWGENKVEYTLDFTLPAP